MTDTRRVDPAELMSVTDIARELDMSVSAVSNYRSRDLGFPEAVVRVSGGFTALFLRADVLAWIAGHGEFARAESERTC